VFLALSENRFIFWFVLFSWAGLGASFAPALILYLMVYTPRGRNRWLVLAIGASTLLAMFIGGQRTPILIFLWAA